MLRAVVDPGVLVAAIITPRGTCGQLLRAAVDGRFRMVASPKLLGELRTVLDRNKFRRYLSRRDAAVAVRALAELVELIADPEPGQARLSPDPRDDYVVAFTRRAKADYLVTGDQHLDAVTDPPVLRPSAFVAMATHGD